MTVRQSAAAIVLVAVLVSSGVAAAGEETGLRVGGTPPNLAFVDIEKKRVGNEDYRGWIQVLTFADRDSSEEMKVWMRDAQIRVTQAHPELPVAYLTFADLAAIPRFMRGMVRPILRRTFENSNEDLAESYRKVGIEPDPDKVAFRFIPDWDGTYLEAFGLEDAATYHCWIAVDGRIVAAFDASTPDIVDRYVEAFDRLAVALESKGGQP
jgi:hypothetical protein